MIKIINTLKNKIALLIGRCMILAISSAEKTQKIQCQGFFNELLTNVERLEPYGLTTVPPVTSTSNEGLNVYLNGNRSQAINLIIHNRELRPTDLTPGDTCMYSVDSTQSTSLNRITISPTTNKIEIKTQTNQNITLSDTGISINGTKIDMQNATDYIIKGTTFDTWLTTFITWASTHTHPTAALGAPSPPTTPPTSPSGHLSTTIKGS